MFVYVFMCAYAHTQFKIMREGLIKKATFQQRVEGNEQTHNMNTQKKRTAGKRSTRLGVAGASDEQQGGQSNGGGVSREGQQKWQQTDDGGQIIQGPEGYCKDTGLCSE